jgi:hypothetical protein
MNGKKNKKTTSKHMKKVLKTERKKKSDYYCSTCFNKWPLRSFNKEQKQLRKDKWTCNNCIERENKNASNARILKFIYDKMELSDIELNQSHHLHTTHEKNERKKSKGQFRLAVLERDEYICQYCKLSGYTIDHMIPISRGGKSTMDNCLCACKFCNHIKGDIPYDIFVKGVDKITLSVWIQLRSEWR